MHIRQLDSQGLSPWQPPGPDELARIGDAETQPGEPSEFTREKRQPIGQKRQPGRQQTGEVMDLDAEGTLRTPASAGGDDE